MLFFVFSSIEIDSRISDFFIGRIDSRIFKIENRKFVNDALGEWIMEIFWKNIWFSLQYFSIAPPDPKAATFAGESFAFFNIVNVSSVSPDTLVTTTSVFESVVGGRR